MQRAVRESGAGSFRSAALYAGPVALSMVPLGVAFGLVLTQMGLAWWWAPIFSAVIYAGSLEFLVVALVSAAAPLSQIAVTALVVNSRHVFYSISFPLHRVKKGPARAYSTFALTDEAYALTALPEVSSWPSKKILTLQFLLQVSWVAGATLGALAGTILPLGALQGFEFALIALFMVLAFESYLANPRVFTVVLAVGIGLAAAAFFPDQMLLTAYTALVVALTATYFLDRWVATRAK